MSCGGAQPSSGASPDEAASHQGTSATEARAKKGASAASDAKEPQDSGDGTLVLRPNFTPHPLVSPKITSQQDQSPSSSPYSKCADALSTKAPTFTFRVAEPLEGMRVRMDGEGLVRRMGGPGVIVFPNGDYYCMESESSEVVVAKWPKGVYKVHAFQTKDTVEYSLRFELPERTKAALAKAVQGLPTIEVGRKAPTNPLFAQATGGIVVQARDARIAGCVDGYKSFTPIVSLKVTEPVTDLYLSVGSNFYLQSPEQDKCFKWDLSQSQRPTGRLKEGVYTVFAEVTPESPPRTYPIEIDDWARPLVLPPRASDPIAVGALDKPLIISKTLRKGEAVPERERHCHDTKMARDPDFYLSSKDPLTKVTVRLLWSRSQVALRVLGPLESPKASFESFCTGTGANGDEKEFSADVFEGTYAVWVGTNDAPGNDFHVAVTREKTKIDPLLMLPVPAKLSLAERSVANHYPFLGARGENALPAYDKDFRLFNGSPEGLFVYPRADIEASDTQKAAPPLKGEPLLVWQYGDDFTVAVTYEGFPFRIPNALLTTDRPAQIQFRSAPRPTTASDLGEAIRMAGSEDQADIDKSIAAEEKSKDCIQKYFNKHDKGNTTTHYEFSRAFGITATHENPVVDQAFAACGYAAVLAADEKLKKTLDARRAKRSVAQHAAVKKQFGL